MRHYIIVSDDLYMAEGIRHLLTSQIDTRENTVTTIRQKDYKLAEKLNGQIIIIHYLPKKSSLQGLFERLIYLSSLHGVFRQLILCDDFYHILQCLPWHVADLKVLNSHVSVRQLQSCISDIVGKYSLKEQLEYIPPYFGLHPRQREVMYLLSRGYTNNEVSFIMNINIKTVSSHKRSAQEVLKLSSRTDYIRFLNLFKEFFSRKKSLYDHYLESKVYQTHSTI